MYLEELIQRRAQPANEPKVVEIDTVKNEPLTLEELQKMDGEPVWVETLRDWRLSHWVILDKKCPVDFDLQDVNLENGSCNATYDLGKTWLAHRRKPERNESNV